MSQETKLKDIIQRRDDLKHIDEQSVALNQLLRRLSENLEIDHLAKEMVGFLSEQFGIQYYVIFRRKSNGDFTFYHSNAEIGVSHESVEMLQNFSMPNSKDNLHAAVCKRKRYIYFRDIKRSAKSESEIEVMQTFPIRTLLIFPLIANNQIFGTIDLSHPTDKIDLSVKDLDAITLFVDHLAIALRNSLLIEAMEKQGIELVESNQQSINERNQIQALNQSLRLMNEALDLDSVLDQMVEYVNDHFGIQYFVLLLYNEVEDSLVFHRSNIDIAVSEDKFETLQNVKLSITDDPGLNVLVFKKKRHIYLRRLRDSPSAIETANFKNMPIKSLLILPLVVNNRSIGTMNFSVEIEHLQFTKNQLSRLSIFSEQFSVVLNNSLLVNKLNNQQLELEQSLQDVKSAQSQIQQLNDFTVRINEKMDFEVLTQDVFDYLSRSFDIEFSWLVLINREYENMFTSTYSKTDSLTPEMISFLDSFHVPLAKQSGTLFRTYQRKKNYYMPRIPANMKLDETDEAIRHQLKLKWFLHVPLIIRGNVIGVLACTNYKKVLHFDKQELQHIQTVVDQVAGAVNSSFLYEQAQSERERADRLLRNILPVDVANELQATGQVASRIHKSSSIAFADFCGFSISSQSMSAEELIQELDEYFYQFDEIMRRHNLTKLKTIGDSYMFVGGIPTDNFTHPVDCCLAALEIQNYIRQARKIKEDLGIPSWQLRIGVNTGSVASGIIGKDRFVYDVWGDTVNIASRMESGGEPSKVNISAATYERVKYFFECEYRGVKKVKNHGSMDMFFLTRLRPKFALNRSVYIPNSDFYELYRKLSQGTKIMYRSEYESRKSV